MRWRNPQGTDHNWTWKGGEEGKERERPFVSLGDLEDACTQNRRKGSLSQSHQLGGESFETRREPSQVHRMLLAQRVCPSPVDLHSCLQFVSPATLLVPILQNPF